MAIDRRPLIMSENRLLAAAAFACAIGAPIETLAQGGSPEKGDHFAAWEQPMLFSSELRAAFRSIRKAA